MTVISKEQPMREGEIAVVDYINGALADKIVELDATDAKLREDLTTETSERKTSDTTLQNNIDTEAAERVKQDTILQANIDAEAVLRDKADKVLQNNIDTETSERKDADTTLQNNIDTETSERKAADTTLQNNIDTETQNRTTSDAALQLAINNEQTARENADSSINTNITNINSDVSVLQEKFPIAKESLDTNLQNTVKFANSLPDIEYGISNQFVAPAKGFIEVEVTFSNSKSVEPIVIGILNVNANSKFIGCYVKYVSFSGATFVIFNDTDSEVTNINIDWLAISGR